MADWSDVMMEATEEAICDGTGWACFISDHVPFTRDNVINRAGAEIAYLAHRRGVRVMYEVTKITTGMSPDGRETITMTCRYYVSSSAHHAEFVKLEKTLNEDSEYLFLDLDEIEAEDMNVLPVECVIRYMLSYQRGHRDIYDMWVWCRDNLQGAVYTSGEQTMFECKDDAVLFKLRFA